MNYPPPSTAATAVLLPPPGWYPDPWRLAAWRWWDGAAWSAVVAPGAGATRPRLPAWLSWPVVGSAVIVVPLLVLAAVLAPLSVLLTVVPLSIVLPVFLWLDRVEPEPRQARVHAFLWGATVAVLVAATVNGIVSVVFSVDVATVVSAPLVEEVMKGLGIVVALRRREIDGVVDGLVYAGWVAAGFAAVENVTYFVAAAEDGSLAVVFVLRGLLTPFAHPLFTVWTGLAIGWSVAHARRVWPRALAGCAVAVALHAAWNGSLVAAERVAEWLVLVAMAVFVAIIVGTSVMLVMLRSRERRLFTEGVPSIAPRYGITPAQGMVFTDWSMLRATRRSLPRADRRRLDRQHAVLARLVALNRRPGGPPADDEQRLVAAWHDSLRPEQR